MAGQNAGRSGRNWRRLKAGVRLRETRCWQCGQAIDWTIPYRDPHTGAINTDAGTVEHILPLSKFPEHAEDPAALKASHLRCNTSAGNRQDRPGFGTPSREW